MRITNICVALLALMAGEAACQTISGPSGTYTSTESINVPGAITLTPPWSGPAGFYTLQIPGPVIVTTTSCSATFTWNPGPPPPSPVETAHLWVIAIYDLDALPNLKQGQIDLHTSTTVKQKLKDLDADWLEFSTKNPESAKYAALLPSLPGILVLKKNAAGKGDVVGTPASLADEASVVSAISKLRGK